MQITNCKLSKRVQKKLLKFFVLQVTARSAADILDIQPNSAILFYRTIRMVISHHLVLAADKVFEAPSSWTKAISADGVKADAVAVRRESDCFRHPETQRTGLYRCRR